ncbi:MAG: hypothetical protein US20_C0007G0009 [Candidatus Pacebacteria bacterium GW2011_GWF1_36_5]|nr:MAG: hypothetical protein US20_C0007G0009 [Candidatus Pacebacteria bacterium GW2011_GWF1_36_5]
MFEFNQGRRDFLKLVTSTGLALGAKLALDEIGYRKYFEAANSDESASMEQLDLVNNPEYWVGENSEKLIQELSEFLQVQYDEIYSAIRNFALEKENFDLGACETEKVTKAVNKLIVDIAKRGSMLVYAQLKNLGNMKGDLATSYYEMASYAQMLLDLIKFKNKVGLEKFTESFVKSIADENIAMLGDDSDIGTSINRKNITACWNYAWSDFGQGLGASSPIGFSFFSSNGFDLGHKPYIFESDKKLIFKEEVKPPVNKGEDWLTKRPNKAKLLNFDSEVKDLVASELKKMGLDRSVNSISLDYSLDGGVNALTRVDSDYSGVNIYYPDAGTIDKKQYIARERELLKLAAHEVYHSLSYRRPHFPMSEKMKVRNLEHEILQMVDPLADLKRVFNPDGDDHGYIEDNDNSITRYYLEHVSGMINTGEFNAKDMLDQFRLIVGILTEEDIFQKISLNEEDKDIDGLLARFEQEISSYKGVTKLIVQTMLDNRESISSRKRTPDFGAELDYRYFPEIIAPLVFAHLVMYKPDELIKSILPEMREQDKGLIANFMVVLQKEMRAFIKSLPSEEFLAELFSEAMLTGKYGKHEVAFVNEIKPKFEQIMAIFRENKLAMEENGEVI